MNITDEYRQELLKLHNNPVFGDLKSIPQEVRFLIENQQIKSILDFGCGKGKLVCELKKKYPNLQVYGYDPAQEQFSNMPSTVDMIISFDVLEHIEPEYIDKTIDLLHNKCTKILHLLIACHPAKRFLGNGKNAHLIIETPEWWKKKFVREGWKIENENIISYTANPKKGGPIQVIKYRFTSIKNG